MRKPLPSRFANRRPKARPVVENKAIVPVDEIESIEPVEIVLEIQHRGNGWFEVGGRRVRGRAAAEELLKEMMG
jgi:hypothetical protein